ncbi:MAG: hypothetical protein QXL96_02495 [Ignisphaera sp.]
MELTKLGFILITLGFVVMFIAIVIPLLSIILSGEVENIDISGGGCIVILFIPICFGFGSQTLVQPLIILAAVLTIITFIIGFLMFKEAKNRNKETIL